MRLIKLLFTVFTATTLALQSPARTTISPTHILPRSTTETASIPTGYFETTRHIILPGVTDAYRTQADKTIDIVVPTCIKTITPDKNGYVPPGTCGSLYNYYPSFISAVVFSVVFGTLTIGHIAQASMLKSVSYQNLSTDMR